MAALVAPAVSLVTKIGEYLVAPVRRHFGYLIFYDRNINNLEEQLQKLEDKKVGTQQDVDAAKRNNKIIVPEVERWLIKVDKLSEEAKKFLEDEEVKANKGSLNGWCPNLKSHYSLSKKAKKMTQDLVQIFAEGNFQRVSYPAPPVGVSYPAPPAGIASISTEGFKGFQSRILIMNEVMEALADDSINMIGIGGMGGVGKTTVVKEVAKKAKEKKLFDEDVMVVVSQNPDSIKIQGGIAEMLHLKLNANISLLERANELRTRISSSKRILVILDDVWERLELDEIGIPFGNDHMGCKIVLTSRSEDVCNHMGTQKKIEVQVLHEEEAWNLFKEVAGIASDVISTTTDLHSTQKAVAKECGGLPIAILTVGRALNDKEKFYWDNALYQLQKAMGKNIRGVDEKVFQSLELSYNYLREEAKKIFLLCSLFPEDFRIKIEDLVRYGIGLKLFEGIGTVGTARNRVHALVNDLMKCYLLMDDVKGVSVRMHDVIRDVAISIASRKEHSFMVRCDEALKEWSEEDRHENYTAISLRCTGMHGLPDNLELPNLKLLRLEYNRELPETPNCFYQGMKEVKVVALSNMDVQSLPTSLQCLTNIRTLSLYGCRLSGDISVIGTLKKLEILSFAFVNFLEELPKEIANLTCLKLFDLIGCQVKRISPGVLSSLSRLEELYVRNCVREWSVPSLLRLEEEEGKEQEIISDAAAASITELTSLSNLVALDIHIEVWPKDFVLQKVEKFKISVGQVEHWPVWSFDSSRLKNLLKLWNVGASVVKSGIKMLLKSTEILELNGIAGLKNIPCDSYKDIFEYLKELRVTSCSYLEYLINTTTTDDDDNDGVVPQRAFPVLEVLELHRLSNFKGIICDGGQQLSKKKKKKEEVELQNLPQIPHHNKRGGPTQLDWLHNLTSVYMSGCGMVQSLFSLSLARGLVQLQTLKIDDCRAMESIVCSSEGGGENETTTAIEFPKLQKLTLRKLSSFIAFCKAVNAIELPQLNELNLIDIPKLRNLCHPASETNCDTIIQPLFDKIGGPTQLDWLRNLTSVEMRRCDMVESLFALSMARGLVLLQKLGIYACEMMESIVSSSEGGGGGEHEITTAVDRIEFPKLQLLDLDSLPSLIAFCKAVNAIGLPQLNELKLTNIPKLRSFCQPTSESNYDTIIRPLFDKIGGPTQLDWLRNLTTVNMDRCYMVESLFTLSMARGLVQLRTLDIRDCNMMESIVSLGEGGGEHEITTIAVDHIKFPKLQELYIGYLPSLIAFCKAVNAIELPQLNKLTLRGIPKLRSLCPPTSESNYDTIIQSLFDKRGGPTQLDWLHNLTSVYMYQCGMVQSLFSLSLARGLVQLQTLEIIDCKMMESIVRSSEGGGEHEKTIAVVDPIEFPKLQKLGLWKLPSFIAFCKAVNAIELPQLNELYLSDIPKLRNPYHPTSESNCDTIIRPLFDKKSGPTQLDWLCNLTSVEMSGCGMIESMFSLSMARGLVQLQRLVIRRCEMMESIVSSSEGGGEHEKTTIATNPIEFPKLRMLDLDGLPSLITFCKAVNAIELPQLKSLILIDIPKLRNLCHPASETNCDTITRRLFDKIGGPRQLDWFCNLTYVQMRKCDMVESLFDLSMARGLVQLQTLDICRCEMMESIVSSSERGGEHEKTTAAVDPIEFPKLQKLDLDGLPSLITFCKAVNAIELPQLNKLKLVDIPKLKSLYHLFNKGGQLSSIEKLFLSGMDNLIEIWPRELKAKLKEMRVGMCHRLLSILFPSNLIECLQNLELLEVKECRSVEVAFDLGGLIVREGHPVVALLSLKYLKLIHLPKLTHVWMNKNSPTAGIQGFNNLTSLTVKGCGSLRNLFSSSSVAKLLVQLQELEITECVAMEAIIAKEQGVDDDDDEVTTTTTNTIIMFPQLTSLKLSALPNLMSFCPQGYTFEGSLLKKVQVINCPKMESLPSQFQKIQALQRSNEGFHEAIQKTDKAPRKFMLTSDGEFTVMEIDDTTELWQNQLEAECLHDVKRMWVQCCGKLSSVVSTSLIQKFHNLKQLKVWWCYSVSVIFDLEGVCAEEGTVTQLNEMEFKYLPKLTDIWKINFSPQTHCFQNLRSLKVKRCDSLKYIFTLSIAKALVNLESLKVGHCEKVEKIVIREEEEEEEEGGITILPKLWLEFDSVRLKDLPSLVCFGIPFEPGLLELQSCPKFQADY